MHYVLFRIKEEFPHIRGILSLLWNKYLMDSSASLPGWLVSFLASLMIRAATSSCQPPRASTIAGKNWIPSLSQSWKLRHCVKLFVVDHSVNLHHGQPLDILEIPHLLHGFVSVPGSCNKFVLKVCLAAAVELCKDVLSDGHDVRPLVDCSLKYEEHPEPQNNFLLKLASRNYGSFLRPHLPGLHHSPHMSTQWFEMKPMGSSESREGNSA